MTEEMRKQIDEEKANDNAEKVTDIPPKVEQALPTLQPTNEQLLETLKNPQNAVKLKVSEKIGDLVENDESVKASVDKTAKQVITDTTDSIENETGRVSDETYFARNKSDLENGGINSATERWYMERVKKVATFWKKAWFIVFGWWVIGLGVWADQIKPLRKPLKVLAYIGAVLILLTIITAIILITLKAKNLI